MINLALNENGRDYFDYKERMDDSFGIEFDVNTEYIVNSNASIKIRLTSRMECPRRTFFRFVIPYGWEPISLKNNFCSVKSSVSGKIKKTRSSIMVGYTLNDPMNPGDYIEFNYNSPNTIKTAGDMAYVDKVYCALDVKRPNEKLFSRIGIKYISMLPDNATFFLVKIPTVYHEKPVDIEIVALDKFGNRDNRFSREVEISGDESLIYPKFAILEKGYVKIKHKLKFKDRSTETSKRSTLLQYNTGYNLFPTVPELESNIGKLYVRCNTISGSSNPIVRDKDIKNNLYWGDTHIHTREFSDGIGTGKDAFHYAKNVVLHDFAALGDHLNQRNNEFMEGRTNISFPYNKTIWNSLISLCKDWSSEDFVAIPGYEWSGRNYYVTAATRLKSPYESISDKVILFPLQNAEDAPLVDYSSENGCFQHQLYESLKDVECAIISHTSLSFVMGTSWTEVDNEMEKVVEIYSSHGSSESKNGNFKPLVNNKKKGSVIWALNNGLKLGFIGGGDDHYSHPGCPVRQDKMKNLVSILRYKPGVAAIFSDNLDSKEMIQNLNERKCYATTGARMWIKIRIESTLMGQQIDISKHPLIIVTVCGTSKLESVELIKNGEVVAIRVPTNDRIKFGYEDAELKKGENAYYYIRATQFDGERGWSSPIWVNYNDR
jgi:hypothetical protein